MVNSETIDPEILQSAIPKGKPRLMPPRTRIICTVAPLDNEGKLPDGKPANREFMRERIKKLAEAGMSIVRINFSHIKEQKRGDAWLLIEVVREVSKELGGRPIGIMIDLCGPRLRIGDMKARKDPKTKEEQPIIIEDGEYTLTTEDRELLGDEERCFVSYDGPLDFSEEIRKTHENREVPIYINDGKVKLCVDRVEGKNVICRIIVGGELRSKAGVVIPKIDLYASAFTGRDFEDLKWIFSREEEKKREDEEFVAVDYIALSFVKRSRDIVALKGSLQGVLKRYQIPIVAKMETEECVSEANMKEILKELADETTKGAVMVARGDLAIEKSHEEVPELQERLVEECNRMNIPVIVATQMLESMRESSTPTRAEVVDVANAVREGADIVMLSAETATGKHPIEATETMARILKKTEKAMVERMAKKEVETFLKRLPLWRMKRSTTVAIAGPACELARLLNSPAIVVCAVTGQTARTCAGFRPSQPIIAVTRKPKTAMNLLLYRGVYPVLITNDPENADLLSKVIDEILEKLKIYKLRQEDGKRSNLVVSTLATERGKPPLSTQGELKTNMMYVTRIKPARKVRR